MNVVDFSKRTLQLVCCCSLLTPLNAAATSPTLPLSVSKVIPSDGVTPPDGRVVLLLHGAGQIAADDVSVVGPDGKAAAVSVYPDMDYGGFECSFGVVIEPDGVFSVGEYGVTLAFTQDDGYGDDQETVLFEVSESAPEIPALEPESVAWHVSKRPRSSLSKWSHTLLVTPEPGHVAGGDWSASAIVVDATLSDGTTRRFVSRGDFSFEGGDPANGTPLDGLRLVFTPSLPEDADCVEVSFISHAGTAGGRVSTCDKEGPDGARFERTGCATATSGASRPASLLCFLALMVSGRRRSR